MCLTHRPCGPPPPSALPRPTTVRPQANARSRQTASHCCNRIVTALHCCSRIVVTTGSAACNVIHTYRLPPPLTPPPPSQASARSRRTAPGCGGRWCWRGCTPTPTTRARAPSTCTPRCAAPAARGPAPQTRGPARRQPTFQADHQYRIRFEHLSTWSKQLLLNLYGTCVAGTSRSAPPPPPTPNKTRGQQAPPPLGFPQGFPFAPPRPADQLQAAAEL